MEFEQPTQKQPKFRKGIAFFVLLFIASGLAAYAALAVHDYAQGSGSGQGLAIPGIDGCNVTGIELRGCLYTYIPDSASGGSSGTCDTITSSEDIVNYLESVKDDGSIKAVYLDIDSPGGMPEAATEIEQALKATGKPVIALIRGNGDSAAYWIASGANTIIASKESDVGSIGVTASYVDNVKQNTAQGLTYNSLSTGKFKDTGDPNKPLTDDEKTYLRKTLAVTLEDFIQTVATNRHLSVEKVRALADGSSMLGEEALVNGLIDLIGSHKEAEDVLQKVIKDKPQICWPQHQN